MAPVPQSPSLLFKASRQALGTVGMWVLLLGEQVLVLGYGCLLEQPTGAFPTHRPFTAEIYRQKASRLHKRS